MKERLSNFHTRLESYLYKRGFRHKELRVLILAQVYLCLGLCLFGLLFLPVTFHLAFIAIGCCLASLNFYHLAKSLQDIVFMRFTSALMLAVLFRFIGRLIVTGLLLYVYIILVKAPIIDLLFGLTAAVGSIFVWGCAHLLEHNGKEA